MDTELLAMQRIAEALSGLDSSAQARVINWAASRFGAELKTASGGTYDGEAKSDRPAFSDFAGLFHAIDPSDNREKALAAAYWLSIKSDGEGFASQAANALLKDIGYLVPNITDALSQCMREKPMLVIQLKKSGTSRQARKLYRVTDAGRKKIEAMMRSDT